MTTAASPPEPWTSGAEPTKETKAIIQENTIIHGDSLTVLRQMEAESVEQTFIDAMKLAGFQVKSEVIWDKVYHGVGDTRAAFAPSHENIVFAIKGKFNFPDRRPKDLITTPKINSSKMVHPTEKPVGLLASLITSVTKPRHQKRFFWDSLDDSFMVRTQEHTEGLLLPANKFIVHKYKARSGHTSRAGILR